MIPKKLGSYYVCISFFISLCEVYGDEKSSITFVIDDTASMQEEIAQVKFAANSIFDSVLNSNDSQIEDYVLVTFNDPSTKLRTITKDRNEFKNALNSIIIDGGGDCPEYAMSGIIKGIVNSRPGTTIYVFTDASALDYLKYEEAKNLAIQKKIQMVFVLTGICSSTDIAKSLVYENLANDTFGQIYNVMKQDVKDILIDIMENVKGRQTIIKAVNFPPGVHKFNISIDGKSKNHKVSISGYKSSLNVVGPDGTKTDTKIILDKDQVKNAILLDPKPGDHTVEVSSPSKTRVVVSARTAVKLQHGFSTFKPTSIDDTTTRPLPDVKSHISIKLTDGDVDLKTIKIFDMGDRLLKEIPLTVGNKEEALFTTEPVDLPNSAFKIAIIAYDPESKTNLTRFGPPITPQPKLPVSAIIDNKAPAVSISGEPSLNTEWNKPLQLRCKVNGYPQPDIIWVNRDTGEELPAKVSTVELNTDYISIVDIDRLRATTNYECKATNAVGSASKTIEAKVTTLPHLTILRPPNDTYINYLDEGKLYCEVDSYPPASITWYKNRRPILKNDNLEFSEDKSVITIKSMKPSDAGSYMCEIRNGIVRKVLSVKVSVANIEAPVINKTTKSLTIRSGSDAVINCNVIKGRPKPALTWFYGDGSSAELIALEKWKDQDTLTIHNAYKSDTGVYACVAKNLFGQYYHEVELSVEYPPKMKRSNGLEKFNVAEGESVFMSCLVDGTPNPKVTWYKDSAPLPQTENIKIYRDNSIRMNVHVTDSGTYTCNATNKLGTASRLVKVDVHVPPTITIPRKSKMEIQVGTTLNLPCNAKGYPTPKTQWTYHSFDSSVPPKPMLKSNGSSVVKLRQMQLGQDGYYTCTATNVGGQSNISYEINVNASPLIENVYLDKEFKVVEGDLVLMIKCKASGNPPPVIRWLKNGYWVATGADFSIENGTLIMTNINEETEGIYVCEAKNSLGFDREVYEVKVQKSPRAGHPTSIVTISEGDSSYVKCDVHHTKTDLLRWYKNGMLIRTGELMLSHAKVNDSGIYTCRVSSLTRAISGNIMVNVGFKPKFITDEDTNIEYIESTPHVLNCEANGEPEPKFTWWHNGEIMNTTENYYYFEMEVGTQGQYVCEARNVFGNAIRSFNVVSKDCLIDIKQSSKLQPLMLTSTLEWTKNEVKNGFMSIAKNDLVVLFCPNQFNILPNEYTAAFCAGGSKFNIHRDFYEYSDIECTEKMTHFIERTGESCFTGNTELVRVVFKVLTKTVEAYEVCLDTDNNRPLYTRLTMRSSVADTDYLETKWADAEEIDLNLDEAYQCDRQINKISSVLGRSFHRDDGCCFGKRQLVSPKDLAPGVAQGTAYSHLNVVPHWSTCNVESNNWNEVEQRVRTLAKATYNELLVSTGVAGELILTNSYRSAEDIYIVDGNNNEQIVPKFLWKVVQEPATNSSLVIIQVNVPDLLPSEAVAYVRCRDICNTTKWMRGRTWYDATKGFTYCCSLNDFENKFGFRGIFEPYNKVLNDVSLIPEYSLT